MSVKHTTQNFYVTESWDGNTLPNIAGTYFCAIDEGYSVNINLPDPGVMSGESLIFVYTLNNGESQISLNGNINSQSGNSFTMNYQQSVSFISDGTTWWVTAQGTD